MTEPPEGYALADLLRAIGWSPTSILSPVEHLPEWVSAPVELLTQTPTLLVLPATYEGQPCFALAIPRGIDPGPDDRQATVASPLAIVFPVEGLQANLLLLDEGIERPCNVDAVPDLRPWDVGSANDVAAENRERMQHERARNPEPDA